MAEMSCERAALRWPPNLYLQAFSLSIRDIRALAEISLDLSSRIDRSGRDLPQSQALPAGPDTHQMQRSELMLSIMRPSQRLAVDAEKFCARGTDQCFEPLGDSDVF